MPGSHGFDSGGSSRTTERPRTGNAWAGIRLPASCSTKGRQRVRTVRLAACGIARGTEPT